MTPIRRPFGVEALRAVTEAAGIDRTVVVQTIASAEETHEFLGLAAASRGLVAGVVGWTDLEDPGVEEAIARMRAHPGGGRLVGVRHVVHDEEDPCWLRRPAVLRGLAAVGRERLVYDLLIRDRELPAAVATVRELPDQAFVVDHMAKPALRNGDLGRWSDGLRALAAAPNVYCKLSGLVTEADWSSWRVDDLQPAVDAVLDWFGPDRMLFGSDWPVCLLAAGYEAWVDTAREMISSLTHDEQARIMGRTATAVYGLAAA